MKTTNFQRKKFKKIADKYDLDLILAFGSQVKGERHSESDLDIAVLPKKNKFNLKKYSALVFDLEKFFSDQKVDLTFIDHADPLLLEKIKESAFLLYGQKRKFEEFQIYAFNRFQDYQPFFKLEEKSVNKFIQELNYACR